MADYKAMADALAATGRPIVLSIEGWEDVRVLSAGGHGQSKRVGHDIGDNPIRPWCVRAHASRTHASPAPWSVHTYMTTSHRITWQVLGRV